MQMDEPSWGKYAIEILYSREQAEERFRWWKKRALTIPGAEVRVWAWRDPLGGERFMLMTQTLELMPEEWRRQQNEAARQRIAEQQRSGSPEDGGALELAARMMGLTVSQDLPASRHSVESLEERLKAIEEKLQRLRDKPAPDRS